MSPKSKGERIYRILLFLPYFLGILWTCLNPVVSIITGELKCRGWYLDEHSIEIKFADSASWDVPSHLRVSLPSKPLGQSNLCEAIASRENLSCHVHGDHFSMVSITPLANALDPIEEAIVLVVPAPPQSDWTGSTFHYTLLTSLAKLADPISTPWLAKTLIVVAPHGDSSLEHTVQSFLNAYLGNPSQLEEEQRGVPPLPPKISGALLRSLVVLDIDDQSVKGAMNRGQISPDQLGRTEFAVLPHGRRGVLPNLDLVFLIGKLFTRTMFLSPQKFPRSTFFAHDHVNASTAANHFVSEQLSKVTMIPKQNHKAILKWSQNLVDMGLFAYSLAMGPYPPHAMALDRGIDSITIQAKFEGAFYRDPSVETIQYMEYLIRALSNLHERLHHSYTLYLLPSPRTFVSHMEYFLPNVLVLLPLAVRGFGLVLWEMTDRLDLSIVGMDLLVTVSAMLVSSLAFQVFKSDISMSNTWILCLYFAIAVAWRKMRTSLVSQQQQQQQQQRPDTLPLDKTRTLQSLQFIACVSAAYILVPIAFAHTSLSYLPSLLWTPLLAFPRYGNRSNPGKIFDLILLIATAPPILLIPRLFDTYTTFIQYAYIPLHLQLLLIVVTSSFS